MHFSTLLTASLAAGALAQSVSVSNPHKRAKKVVKRAPLQRDHLPLAKRQSQSYLTPQTEPFEVNGTGIPEVNFDIGESYAGTLSIDGNATNENQLFFWFFPSDNPAASDEITIWLNGGPGCSSLDGLLQEHGPFLWQSGTYAPQRNQFSFTNLTNMVYIDQPIGTGFSPAADGAPGKIRNETDVARQFAGFWKNFMTTFNMTGRKVYLTGESYAGMYIPYIADYFISQNNTDYYNVAGIQINDPSIGLDSVLIEVPAVTHLNNYANVFGLNQTFMTAINKRAHDCGFPQYMDNALTFPPKGKFKEPVNATNENCFIWEDIIAAAIYVNPCFNFYHLTDFCPFPNDELGFPSEGDGPNNYFNRSDVQQAIHAPPTSYAICGDPELFPKGDPSPPSSFTVLPRVIEHTNNVIVGSGLLDYLLLTNGTLMTLNNMTWNGKQGFQTKPSGQFFVPYNPTIGYAFYETFTQAQIPELPVGLVAGGGIMGTTHTERGLTWVTVDLAGHEIPQYVPGASYRQLELLLGRIKSLTQIDPHFTTQSGNYSGSTPL
ncbi:hypothetical protein G647_02997 [Cladophialophora carrionii CBS 160.54]|uniref:Carboxypeptidase n=1 Tax=Cladophialophora carrionii CBS 160.54 TaxID=1279043 RepID=V9DH88_9EURO|nr:uncharacterized protein G647_02997 [Cladophialophora carrionii CBS 160.54]ETI26220.1 hypothetical protein G647_02997 [Cladophialophora carrionii CBS 160.54]